ncbi:hypothetical protein GCM10027190_24920 [Spirosoma areae]
MPLLAQQTTTTPDAPAKTRMGRNQGMRHQAVDPATRAQKMTDRMTKQLSLDEATSKKVYALTLARAEKMDAIQKSADDRKTKVRAMKANADEFSSQLKSTLTTDQYAAFESMRSQMGKGRHAGGARGSKDGTDQK